MKDMNEQQEFDPQEEGANIENMAENVAETLGNDDDSANLADDLEIKFQELNDSYLRLHAEFDNYRKRTMKEKADLIRNGGEKTLLGFLPIMDDFDRALTIIPEEQKEGLELIYNKFKSALTQNGVKVIDALGEAFDTERHEAITTIPAQSDDQKGKVIDCVQNGYALNDKIIRFAKVIVAK
jgi:molecular chaperone GrpE